MAEVKASDLLELFQYAQEQGIMEKETGPSEETEENERRKETLLKAAIIGSVL